MGHKIYRVGDIFPDPDFAGITGSAALLTNDSFNAALFTPDIPKEADTLFRKGTARYGIFTRDHIPFVLFLIGTEIIFEMPITLTKMPRDIATRWLDNPKANAVNLYLVDQRNFILKSIRSMGVSLEFMDNLKETLRKQYNYYASDLEAVRALNGTEEKFNTSAMIARTKFYKHEEVGQE